MKVISFLQRSDEGQSVLWFVVEGTGRTRVASAFRNRVEFDRDDIPWGVFDAAHGVHRELRRDPNADLRHYAVGKDGA